MPMCILHLIGLTVKIVYGCEKYFTSDCQEIKDLGFNQSGVYNITPLGTYGEKEVYCDMETDGGGWLEIRFCMQYYCKDTTNLEWDNITAYARYEYFKMSDTLVSYTITVGDFSGDAGDSLKFAVSRPFTAKDKGSGCNTVTSGAWWYKTCYDIDLNGLYLQPNNHQSTEGIKWDTWKGNVYSLKKTEMKIRRILV